jgi:hypothetical protein
MGMLWMILGGQSSYLATAARWAHEHLPQGCLTSRTNKLTLLDNATRGFGGAAAMWWGGEAGRRQRLVGMHDPDGERRHLFGVGEGPAEAVAGAKQDPMGMPEICVNFVSVATGKSLLAPLVTHLSTT